MRKLTETEEVTNGTRLTMLIKDIADYLLKVPSANLSMLLDIGFLKPDDKKDTTVFEGMQYA